MAFITLNHSLRGGTKGQEKYIVDPASQELLTISDVVLDVLNAIHSLGKVDEIVARISGEYGLDSGEAEIVVWDALHQLMQNGLVTVSSNPLERECNVRFFESASPVKRALLSLTHRCNFRCMHCLQGDGATARFNELSTEKWMNIIDQLSEHGLSHIFFTGGEPLLRKDICDLIARAADHAFPTRLYTNGLLIDETLVSHLRRFDTLIVQVSLHGRDSATVDPFVGVDGAFDRVTESIRAMADAGIRVSVSTSFRDELMPFMEEFPPLLQKLGVSEWIPTMIMPIGCAFSSWRELRLSSPNLRMFMENLFRFMSIYKGHRGFSINSPFDVTLLQGDVSEWKGSTISFGCNLYGQYINIQPDGSITPCDRLTKYCLGSLKDESLVDLMSRNGVMQAHRDDVRKELESIGSLTRCGDCAYGNLCGMGCPGILFQGRRLGEKYDDPVVCRMFNECFDVVLKYSTPDAQSVLLRNLKRK
jgi:radical SAM protein with 4Fe4S-binding SPASM domain